MLYPSLVPNYARLPITTTYQFKRFQCESYHDKTRQVKITKESMFLGYSLDVKNKVKVQKLEFEDTFDYLILNLEPLVQFDAKERLEIMRAVLSAFESKSEKGFVTSCDLRQYPIISELIPSFFNPVEDVEYVSGTKSKESYK